jgi:hypothetical protein
VKSDKATGLACSRTRDGKLRQPVFLGLREDKSPREVKTGAAGLTNATRSSRGLPSIVPALLYLKMRQLGGENLADTLAEIEDADDSRSHWQERMRTRLSLHPSRGRTTDGKREDSPYQHREP